MDRSEVEKDRIQTEIPADSTVTARRLTLQTVVCFSVTLLVEGGVGRRIPGMCNPFRTFRWWKPSHIRRRRGVVPSLNRHIVGEFLVSIDATAVMSA